MLNNPNPASFQVYGVQPAPRTVADDGVEGGRALPVPVTGKGDAWAAGVNVPIIKPVKAGDKITIYFWARLQGGTGSASIASAQLQLASAPYTRIFGEGVTITPMCSGMVSGGKLCPGFVLQQESSSGGLVVVLTFT